MTFTYTGTSGNDYYYYQGSDSLLAYLRSPLCHQTLSLIYSGMAQSLNAIANRHLIHYPSVTLGWYGIRA